jgi:outer membrane protein assembly factor BamD
MTFYKKTLKAGRDQTKTVQALAEFKKLITEYPASDQAKETQEKIKDCEERLADHETSIGTQYAKLRAYGAAISRLSEVMTTYPNYSHMDVIYFYLGESRFQAKAPAQAVPYFTKLVSDYPKSKLVKKATARLKQIEAQKNAVPSKVK